ncbi:MAG TPA: hypothetical protein VGB30_10280 [bacterium]|jgi:hypothetical protein
MIRFLRNLIFVIILIFILGYIAIIGFKEKIIERIQEPLTGKLIAEFAPGEDSDFGSEVEVKIYPLEVRVHDFFIEAPAMRVGQDVFTDVRIEAGEISCELLPILKDQTIVIKSVSGRTFRGMLPMASIAEKFEREWTNVRDIEVDEYGDRSRISGYFGTASVMHITIYGVWAVEDRGVITLVERDYHNPDSRVPLGAVQFIENNIDFDIRINLFDEQLSAVSVGFTDEGLTVTASDAE